MKKNVFLIAVFLCLTVFSCITVDAAGDWFSLSFENGAVSDVSEHAFPLAKIGAPQITEDGLCLNNGSAYGVTLSDAHNALLSDGFSIQARIYLEEKQPTLGNCDVLGSKEGKGFALEYHAESNKMTFLVSNADGYVGASVPMFRGKWYDLLCIYDGLYLRVWLDGVPMATRPCAAPLSFMPYDTKCMYIGADADANGNPAQFANVRIASLDIYSEPLPIDASVQEPTPLIGDFLAIDFQKAPFFDASETMHTLNGNEKLNVVFDNQIQKNCAVFPGTSHIYTDMNTALYEKLGGGFSVETYVYIPSGQTAGTAEILGCKEGVGFALEYYPPSRSLNFMASVQGVSGYKSAGTVITEDAWHHVIGIADGTYIMLYVDGVLCAKNEAPSPFTFTSGNAMRMYLGADVSASGDAQFPVQMQITHFNMFSYALNDEDIFTLIRQARPKGDFLDFDFTAGNVIDASPNALSPVAVGNPSVGKIGEGQKPALTTDTASDYYVQLNDDLFAEISESFTAEATIYINPVAAKHDTTKFFSTTQSAGTGFLYVYSTNILRYVAYINGSYVHVEANIPPGAWYHVAATYNGSALRLYVDGTYIAETACGSPITYIGGDRPLQQRLYFGGDIGGSANAPAREEAYAPLHISSMRMHRRVLSDSVIKLMSYEKIAQQNGANEAKRTADALSDGVKLTQAAGWNASAASATDSVSRTVKLHDSEYCMPNKILLYPVVKDGVPLAFPSDFAVYTSTDNNAWVKVHEAKNVIWTQNMPYTLFFPTSRAQYVKIEITRHSDASFAQTGTYCSMLSEIEVYYDHAVPYMQINYTPNSFGNLWNNLSKEGKLRMAVFSDTHIGSELDTTQWLNKEGTYSDDRLAYAFDIYNTLGGIDAAVVVGDITNCGFGSEYEMMKKLVYDGLDHTKTKMLYCVGNHEYYDGFGYNPDHTKTLFANHLGRNQSSDQIINGYHVITMGYTAVRDYLDPGDEAWLKAHITNAIQENPNKPVFVMTHQEPDWNGDGSDNRTFLPMSAEFRAFLKTCPQVIVFSGHTHNSLYDYAPDASICHMGYTSIKTGTIGGNNNRSHGLMVDVDENHVVTVYRLDLGYGTFIEEPYVIDIPALVAGQSSPYTKANRLAASTIPKLSGSIALSERTDTSVKLTFPAAVVTNDRIKSYTVTIKDYGSGSVISTQTVSVSLVKPTVPTSYSTTLSTLSANTYYTVDIVGNSCLGQTSNIISQSFSTQKNHSAIDGVSFSSIDSSVHLWGWAVDRNGTKRIEYVINGSHVVPATRIDRPDVPLVHPGYPDGNEGFDDHVSVNEGFVTGNNTIEIRLISTDGSVFSLGTRTIQISVPTGCSVSADAYPCLDTSLAVDVNKGNASSSVLKITDSRGNVIQTFPVTNQSTVSVTFPDEGVYALTLESTNASGTNYAKTDIEVGGKTGKIASYYLNGAVTIKAYEDTQDALFYMASYDADGRFLGFSSQRLSLNAGDHRTITPTIFSGSKTLRLFTLDSLSNLNTLQQVSTYTVE